jgi:peptide/nickel transport system permease protein
MNETSDPDRNFSLKNVLRGITVFWKLQRQWPIIPALILLILIVTGVFASSIAPYDPIKQNLRLRNAPPSLMQPEFYEEKSPDTQYLLGGDHVGRDIFSRLVHGARISLMLSGVALITGIVVGVSLGLVSGFYGGLVDEIIMRLVDVWFSLPFLLLAMVATIVFGTSFNLVLGLLALLAWSGFVRNVRAEVLTLKERDYVSISRICGASGTRIISRHLLPGVMNTVLVIASLRVGNLILAEASLSFLGAGIPSPTPAWGVMIAEAREYVQVAWWGTVFPGLAILLIVMSLNFLGDWIRDRLDPQLRQQI